MSSSLSVSLWNIYNCVTLSLKLPMDSKGIESSSSNFFSFSNVTLDFHIYIARQSATLTKISKWCFVWQYKYGWLLLHIGNYVLLQKYLFYNDCLDLRWSIVVKKWNDIPSQTGLSNHYSWKHNIYSKYVLLS